ncbi:hypothetical protein INP85_09140 [Haemophilus parainfluenzae]|uniref:hypothetical protein n=1 Tax=Haemophilus parainfluenzae TaxID=729 RepID=UPI0018752351|nr:hypothetical protein [Haemophilus parainfluenzae]MBE4953150.1 hypothetical protein [Haemophilus parainfluenzae]
MFDEKCQNNTESVDDKIKKWKSVTYLFCLVILTVVVSIKIILINSENVFKDFNFTDLLSLLLAFFSITISIVFYLKAGETANQFYDNTYKFTQHTSEVLGRIESGFGERLRNINESYNRLGEDIRRYSTKDNIVKEEIKNQVENIEKNENVQKEIVNKLFENSKLDEDEKEQLKKELIQSNEKLAKAREQIANLERKSILTPFDRKLSRAKRYYQKKLKEFGFGMNTSIEEVNEGLSKAILIEKLPRLFIKDLLDLDIINEDYELTDYGVKLTKDLLMMI